jgi:hypothetical protein
MGYDLHITRRADWNEEGNDITAEEWLKIVAADPELTLRPENGPHFAQWSGVSKLPGPWLDWSDGQIFTKNPDRALGAKMISIAQKLSASVQGDDGETYSRLEDFPEETVTPATTRPANHTLTVVVIVCILLASIVMAIVGRDLKQRSMGIVSALFWSVCLVWLIKQPR